MNLLDSFLQNIKDHHLFHQHNHLLLAVSGGCDSMVMVNLCLQAKFNFSIAHCNFGLRGAESDAEENLVTTFAERHQIPLFLKKFDVQAYEQQHRVNTQVAARELRYNWFSELVHPASGKLFEYILTAHNANDNIETVLMNFFKGTGLKGLTGIAVKNGKLIRPLLFVTRKEIESYAKEQELNFLTDSSNLSNKYSRNFIRNKVLPLLAEKYPQIESNILDDIDRFENIHLIFEEAIAAKKKRVLEFRKDEVYLPILKLQKEKGLPALLYECIKDFGFSSAQLPDILQLLVANNSKYVTGKSHHIIKNRNWLVITPIHNLRSELILIEKEDKKVPFVSGVVQVKEQPVMEISQDKNIALLDASKIVFPLILRKCKTGDYFYPLGMPRKKKIARFLIDNKLSKSEKENVWVLESDNKIIWVIGHRIDNRFKVKENTKNFIQFLFVANTI